MMTVEIPEKLYFKIGEVARLAGVETYVLRYWETEFKEINPVKSRTNQRLYRRKDIDTVISIKQLLYGEGFTIEGARKKLKEVRGDREEVIATQDVPASSVSSLFSSTSPAPPASEIEQLFLFQRNQPDAKLLRQLKSNLEELLKVLES